MPRKHKQNNDLKGYGCEDMLDSYYGTCDGMEERRDLDIDKELTNEGIDPDLD